MSEDAVKPKSDLGVRVASAFVMIGVASFAFWLGGPWFDIFAVVVGIVCYIEFFGLVQKISARFLSRLIMALCGAVYIGSAIYIVTQVNSKPLLLLIVGSVVCVDTFAYFFGRTIGGPKIAPSISPSKTWAGLLGGIVGATVAFNLYFLTLAEMHEMRAVGLANIWLYLLAFGALLAVIAQAGDFLESWLKRKAGVKDSSNLIPGHGGVFDRIDGMLPVAIAIGLPFLTIYPHWLNR
jgi:phosphatidate cytidylyltransferase